MAINRVFELYHKIVKPLYVEIEARGNRLPVEFLFEIHAAFDHLSRVYSDNEAEDKCADKALSHLKRGVLDVFKLKLKHCNEKIVRVERVDLTLIDNGEFYKEFIQLKVLILKTAKKARLEEKKVGSSTDEIVSAFETWLEVSSLIDEMEEKFLHSTKIHWASKKTLKLISLTTGIGIVIGIVGSFIATYLWEISHPQNQNNFVTTEQIHTESILKKENVEPIQKK